ncbi:hypothetical protein BT93_B0932 [Corymbia citriodora subsp. variegata]|nr:hypothetical protein BT93_B0932 [Corymbia citriodora subsp. variegata]
MVQEPVLFPVSVGENIAYGLPGGNVSKHDVIKAAKVVNVHKFVICLPQVCLTRPNASSRFAFLVDHSYILSAKCFSC